MKKYRVVISRILWALSVVGTGSLTAYTWVNQNSPALIAISFASTVLLLLSWNEVVRNKERLCRRCVRAQQMIPNPRETEEN